MKSLRWPILLIAFAVIGGSMTYTYVTGSKKADLYFAGSPVLANGLEDMSQAAPAIVAGSFQKHESTVNGARNPKDPSKPAADNYEEVNVYTFQVDEVLKGKVPSKIIRVGYAKTMELNHPKSNGKITIKHPLQVHPAIGRKYILFLNEPDLYTHFYTSAFTPSLIEIKGNQTVELKLPDKGLKLQKMSMSGEVVSIGVEGFPDDYQDTVSGMSVAEVKDIVRSTGN
ncbi:hypothetical protein ACFO25_03045 [Paenactinomyces guangxiensis]|uniref:Uncharacterized protein n=1 Tax=Paenactinomyces guangxiensis TaxID=1490290 RepID=A0A7W1WTA8_9BACL|nr:hypothetical protein [Paenactinomyces guangxiensis]MBA4495660.1 hypothetical protein [Paenactinomyces guangxiensis]MBH8592648.1 hypothetical protein [Paenactinomyces guangxiensis]